MENSRDCALIPAYNEESTIEQVVEEVKELGILPIVIDDRSIDKTSEIAKKSGATVLNQTSNYGKGEAIRAGISYVLSELSSIENIVFIDADMQYTPKECQKLLEPLRKDDADIVMGYRDWSTVPFRHKLGNLVWRISFNLLFGTNLKDTNCGFMSMNRDSAEKLEGTIYGGYILENAILANAVRKGLRISQVPVNVSYEHKSNLLRGIRMVVGITIFIIKEGFKYRLGINKKLDI